MTEKRRDQNDKNDRDARRSAALRANLARRKAQARARADQDEPENGQTDEDRQ